MSCDDDDGILLTYFHVRNSHSFPVVQIISRSGNVETESKNTLRMITSSKDRRWQWAWFVTVDCSTAIDHTTTIGSYAIFLAITLQSMPLQSTRMEWLWAVGIMARLTSGTMRAATAFKNRPLSLNLVGFVMRLLWIRALLFYYLLLSYQAPWMLSVGYMLQALIYRAG